MTAVHRIEVRPRSGAPDPGGDRARSAIAALGVATPPREVDATRIYLLEGELDAASVAQIAHDLLGDPVTEDVTIGTSAARGDAIIEVHPLPGVMDPDAAPIEKAITAMTGTPVRVQTGHRYDIHGMTTDAARTAAERSLANPVVHAVHDQPWLPDAFPQGHDRPATVRDVPIRDLDDDALTTLSRDGHLFLDLEEMHALQSEYRRLEREPREIELETLAQTWSEHCVHKTLKARIRYRGDLPRAADRPGHTVEDDGSIVIDNLLKQTVAAATHELIADGIDWCISVFVDNAGIVAFDDEHAVCFKVETHNHPSAIEPYGGAATGIGGCIRDIIGTGLAAKPIAATDVFCVAHPDRWARAGESESELPTVPDGCLHPKRILEQVVAGVRDYGNRMGIPTLNGTVWFDDNYVGNPLVYCGCIGVMPVDRTDGDPMPGDHIIAVGGRTGRDGIHGATFSSAELTDTHADEFAHAVQIGDAITEKKVLDVILAAREGGAEGRCLFRSITDCGAGGFSSAVGEMGEKLGAEVHLDRIPTKYDGLTPTELWISEAQERMVLAVPPGDLEAFAALCTDHDVEWCDLGHFGVNDDAGDASLILRWHGDEVGRMSMHFLHEGLPDPVRDAEWIADETSAPDAATHDTNRDSRDGEIDTMLRALLAHPNIASKHWIIRQYDHEVQGGTVIKPLVGPDGHGPGDAAVVRPVDTSDAGLAISNGLATGWCDDPYAMALAAVDECVRNAVCVGGDPTRLAILDNFCWPSCKKPRNLGGLVRAAEGCYDAAIAFRTPFISGKDSLNNQFTTDDGRTIEIPPTLLISGCAHVEDLKRCVTMDLKEEDNLLVVVGETDSSLRGSHAAMIDESLRAECESQSLPLVDLVAAPKRAASVSQAIASGLVRSAHDASEGGVLLAATEMAMAGGFGLELDFTMLPAAAGADPSRFDECFAETPSRYLLEVERGQLDAVSDCLDGAPHAVIGVVRKEPVVKLAGTKLSITLDEALATWRAPLDWNE